MMGGCLMAIDLSMLGWILHRAGKSPTIINGADMKNFIDVSSPFASARIGEGEVFVSEVDESDGSITFFEPRVAVGPPCRSYCSRLSPPTGKLQLIDVFPGSSVHPGHRQIFRTMERAERLSTAPADESRLPRRAIFPKCVSRDQGATFEAKPIDESTAPSRKSTNSVVAGTVASGREAPVPAGNGKRPHRTLPHAGSRDSDTARGD
jgi:hypothetical protein